MRTIDQRPHVTPLLRVGAVLWLIWGLVHAFFGVLVMGLDTTDAVEGIANGVNPATLDLDYPDALGAIINQHGWNLLWFGAVTMACAWFIWRRSLIAVLLAALVGGLADLGYFVFLDLGGYVEFVPGTLMTIISAAAIITTFTAVHLGRQADSIGDAGRSDAIASS